MKEKILALLKSRRFWASVVGLIVVIANERLGLNLDKEQLLGFVMLIVTWVAGDTLRKTE